MGEGGPKNARLARLERARPCTIFFFFFVVSCYFFISKCEIDTPLPSPGVQLKTQSERRPAEKKANNDSSKQQQ